MDWRGPGQCPFYFHLPPPLHISALVHWHSNPRCSLSMYILGRGRREDKGGGAKIFVKLSKHCQCHMVYPVFKPLWIWTTQEPSLPPILSLYTFWSVFYCWLLLFEVGRVHPDQWRTPISGKINKQMSERTLVGNARITTRSDARRGLWWMCFQLIKRAVPGNFIVGRPLQPCSYTSPGRWAVGCVLGKDLDEELWGINVSVRRPAQSRWGINSVSSRSPQPSLNLPLFLSLHLFLIFLLCHFHLAFLLFFHFFSLWCGGRLIMARGLDKLSPQPSGDWATCVPLCEPTDMKTHKHTHIRKSMRKQFEWQEW